jgi:2,3-bisphosphoglycerate-dependent phosphoglycerate mutase
MAAMATLVLLRHGESVWNRENLFTGWYDCDLSEEGEKQARNAGRLLAEAELRPTVCHTSVLKRAVRTANLALEELDLLWIPVTRHWRLNERHYGALQGLNKKDTLERYGEQQFMLWRRSYDVPPPALDADDERHPRFDARYAGLAADVLPATECLKDVVARMLPYWYDAIVPDLVRGEVVLVAAHGNSLRALVKHLDGLTDDEVVRLNIPTGQPLVYELDERMRRVDARYLDPEAAAIAAEAVKNQGR